MKKMFAFLVAVLLMASLFAQSPEKISYQAVIRNSSDALVTNQAIGMRISILQGSASGTAVYVETQTPTTNANGLVSIEIGGGTIVTGNFAAIDWANGPHFIKTETAVQAPLTTYTITGTSQLLSVPYALYAKTAETVIGTTEETDPVYTGSQAANITTVEITKLNNLSGVNTGDQDLTALATKTALGDSIAKVRSEMGNVNGVPGTTFISDNAELMPTTGQLPMYDGSTYTTLLRFTVPVVGLYWVSLHTETYEQINFVNPVMSLCAIFKNGMLNSQPTQNISQHNIQRPMMLEAGDVIELKCASNLGGGYALNSHGYIMKVNTN